MKTFWTRRIGRLESSIVATLLVIMTQFSRDSFDRRVEIFFLDEMERCL